MSVDRAHELAVVKRECAEGRLTLGEFATAARAIVDGNDYDQPTEVGAYRDEPRRSRLAAVFGSARHRVRRLSTDRLTAVAVFGSCHVDLTDARVEGDEVVVTAVALFGTVKVFVPRGLVVEVSGVPVLGTTKDLTASVDHELPGAPRVAIRAVPAFGAVKVFAE